jgi:hypothetical protein
MYPYCSNQQSLLILLPLNTSPSSHISLLRTSLRTLRTLPLRVAQELGISVSRVPSYSPHAVAEFALTLMMALNRKVARSYARTRSGNFSLSGLVGWDVHGKVRRYKYSPMHLNTYAPKHLCTYEGKLCVVMVLTHAMAGGSQLSTPSSQLSRPPPLSPLSSLDGGRDRHGQDRVQLCSHRAGLFVCSVY